MSNYSTDTVQLLRWWHKYQVQTLCFEADAIRNGLLQEIFVVRRHLELICQSRQDGQSFSCEPCLTELEQIYDTVESLSDRLGSLYLQSSFPMALQHTIQPWCSKLNLEMEVPPTWGVEPAELTKLLMTFIGSLCRCLENIPLKPHHCNMRLKHQANSKEFSFYAFYDDLSMPSLNESIPNSLTYMLETFQVLTQGEYIQATEPYELIWVLHWPYQKRT